MLHSNPVATNPGEAESPLIMNFEVRKSFIALLIHPGESESHLKRIFGPSEVIRYKGVTVYIFLKYFMLREGKMVRFTFKKYPN